MAPSWVGAMQHSIRLIGSGMSKWMPANSLTARSASCCIHSRKASAPRILPLRVVIQRRARRLDVRAADQSLGDRPLLVLNAVQFVETPRVGLLQIDLRTEEVARVEGIAFLTDRIQAGCQWRQLGTEPGSEVVEGDPPLVSGGHEFGVQGGRQVVGRLRDQAGEEIVLSGLAGP